MRFRKADSVQGARRKLAETEGARMHYTLDPSRCIKLGASLCDPPVAQMKVADDRLSRVVTHLREWD